MGFRAKTTRFSRGFGCTFRLVAQIFSNLLKNAIFLPNLEKNGNYVTKWRWFLPDSCVFLPVCDEKLVFLPKEADERQGRKRGGLVRRIFLKVGGSFVEKTQKTENRLQLTAATCAGIMCPVPDLTQFPQGGTQSEKRGGGHSDIRSGFRQPSMRPIDAYDA